MSDQTDNLIFLLKPFGLTEEESKIYLNLLKNNSSTALSISRNINMGRTKVYRILDKLIEKQLVAQQFDGVGFKFKANHPSKLEFILDKKETELSSLRKSLPETLSTLESHINIDHPESQVLYYRGQEGLSQVNWNLLKADGEFLSYEVENANAYLPFTEAEKLRKELINKKIIVRTLTNKAKIDKFTQIDQEVDKLWQAHFISPKTLTIRADIFIYNDIFTICHYLENNDIFCLEIKNEYLVKMQKEIFENLWSQSTSVDYSQII
jgi:sugar-specific transcriptional regulator TrmB